MVELKVGGYYYATRREFSSFIVKVNCFDGRYIRGDAISVLSRSYYRDSNVIVKDTYQFIEATQNQIMHLENCIAKGRYTSAPRKSKIVQDYQVF